jgi:hypothetical protein
MGIERMILLLQDAGRGSVAAPFAYVVHAGEAGAALARAAAETLLTAFLIHYALMWERTWDLIRPSRQTTP